MIRTYLSSRLAAFALAFGLVGATACAQTKPVLDMQKATTMTHAQLVKLLGKPIEIAHSNDLPGKPLIYGRWHNKDFVWLRMNYRNGKPVILSALIIAKGRYESPEGLMKALNINLGKKYGKATKGYAMSFKTKGGSVEGTPFSEIYLRRSQLNDWDREKDTTEKMNLPKGTYFWKVKLTVDEKRGSNVLGAGGR